MTSHRVISKRTAGDGCATNDHKRGHGYHLPPGFLKIFSRGKQNMPVIRRTLGLPALQKRLTRCLEQDDILYREELETDCRVSTV